MSVRSFEGHTPQIDASAWVDETAVVIGDVTVGPEASLWPMVVARGDVHRIRVGARTNIQDGSVLHVTHAGEHATEGFPLAIGEDVTVGHRAVLHGCTIGDFVLIGMGATVMDGAVVASRSMIAAGALVPPGKVLETGYLWVGSPVRRARALSEPELALIEYSPAHYVRLKERHGAG